MGSGNCFSSNNDNQSKNLYENNIEASNIEENPQKNKEPEIPIKKQILVSENEAVSIQSALRGYTARKDLQKPLFNIKESRCWDNIVQNHSKPERPLSEIQHKSVSQAEDKLQPIVVERPNDGVKVQNLPALKLEDGSIYEGEWDSNGNKHGLGTLFTKDGSKLTGCFKSGLMEGIGRMIASSGLVLQGEFKEGKLNGNGKILRETGATFDGELLNGKIHGKGVEEWPDGTKYEGEYDKGIRHGKGTLSLGDGSVYTGSFKNGKMHGKGTFVWKNGNKYKGE